MTETRNKSIGIKIKTRRKEFKLSQRQLGDAVGVTAQQIQKYETGMNDVSMNRLEEISKALKVPLGYFYSNIDDQNNISFFVDNGKIEKKEIRKLVNIYKNIGDTKRKQCLIRLLLILEKLINDNNKMACPYKDYSNKTPSISEDYNDRAISTYKNLPKQTIHKEETKSLEKRGIKKTKSEALRKEKTKNMGNKRTKNTEHADLKQQQLEHGSNTDNEETIATESEYKHIGHKNNPKKSTSPPKHQQT